MGMKQSEMMIIPRHKTHQIDHIKVCDSAHSRFFPQLIFYHIHPLSMAVSFLSFVEFEMRIVGDAFMLDIKAVSYAVCAAHHKSFNAAAKHLGLEQSLLSRRIKALEDDLDIVIFERSAHGVCLTAAGAQFIKHSSKTLQVVNDALETLSHQAHQTRGEIWIGVAAPFSDTLLHDFLHSFREAHQEVSIHIIEGSKTEVLRMLSLTEIDLAIVHDRPIGQDCEAGRHEINRQCFWSTRLFVALPAEHQMSDQPSIHLRSLLSERILIGAYGCDATINDYNTALSAVDCRRPCIEQHMIGREGLINLVSIGFGITFTNEFRAAKNTPGVVIKPLSGGIDRLNYCGSWLAKNDNPALHSFLSLALSKAAFSHSASMDPGYGQ